MIYVFISLTILSDSGKVDTTKMKFKNLNMCQEYQKTYEDLFPESFTKCIKVEK